MRKWDWDQIDLREAFRTSYKVSRVGTRKREIFVRKKGHKKLVVACDSEYDEVLVSTGFGASHSNCGASSRGVGAGRSSEFRQISSAACISMETSRCSSRRRERRSSSSWALSPDRGCEGAFTISSGPVTARVGRSLNLDLELDIHRPPQSVRAWWTDLPDEYVAKDPREQPHRIRVLARNGHRIELEGTWRGPLGRGGERPPRFASGMRRDPRAGARVNQRWRGATNVRLPKHVRSLKRSIERLYGGR